MNKGDVQRHNFDSNYSEKYALLSLQALFPDRYVGMSKGECPDWYDESKNTGVEVTRALSPEEGYYYSYWNRNYRKSKDEINKKNLIKFEQNSHWDNGILNYVTRDLPNSSKTIETICDAIKKKLELLNGNYTKFKTNELYVFSSDDICEEDIKSIVSQYDVISDEYQTSFDTVFINTIEDLWKYERNPRKIDKYNFSDEDLRSFKEIALS